jgi:hypothetical protein
MNFAELNLPNFQFRLKTENDKTYIFDVFRKKHVLLTPEEWVRQNLLEYLVQHKNYPRSWIAVEKEIDINGLKRRYDALIYKPDGSVHVLIECKAPKVKITEEVFKQIAAYNYKLEAPLLIVSNGLKHYIAEINIKEQAFKFLKEIPMY